MESNVSVYIIAEAGVNHNGSMELARKMVEKAKWAGADCIKFQTFISKNLVSHNAKKAEYQKQNTGNDDSQLQMLQKLELSFENFRELKDYCQEVGIDFLSTPFDFESLDFLNELGVPFWKIPSGEVTNYPYLVRIAKTKRPVVMSTGMCDLEEIEAAIEVLKDNGTEDLQLLHCNTEYPTPFEDVNLYAMKNMEEHFGYKTGYSDHTKGIEVPIAAAASGACIVEKHFTLDKTMDGPDHVASLDPIELKEMVSAIRNIEQALGAKEKIVTPSEKKNREIARKSIVAGRAILKGEKFTEENLTVKRPGNGISPMRWNEVLGKEAIKDFNEDELIEL